MLSSRDCVGKGRIHTLQSFSAVDGPGIRTMVFFQGCHLGCHYCHNKATWSPTGGTEMTVDAVMDFIESYRTFYEISGGGVTFSGGEPLLQGWFLLSLLKTCRAKGIHTALETSGYGIETEDLVAEILQQVDLVILDVKKPAQSLEDSPIFIRQLAKTHKPVWLRHVVLPEAPDAKGSNSSTQEKIEHFGSNFSGTERIEPLKGLLGACSFVNPNDTIGNIRL